MKQIVFFITTPLLFVFSCKTKNDVKVEYTVSLTKLVDSLPCRAEVEFTDYGSERNSKHTDQISANWTCTKICYYDTEVTLKAKALENIKSLKVEISAYGTTVSETADPSNGSAYVSKALYNKN